MFRFSREEFTAILTGIAVGMICIAVGADHNLTIAAGVIATVVILLVLDDDDYSTT